MHPPSIHVEKATQTDPAEDEAQDDIGAQTNPIPDIVAELRKRLEDVEAKLEKLSKEAPPAPPPARASKSTETPQ